MKARIGVTRIMTFGYAAGGHNTRLRLDIEDVAWKLIHSLEGARAAPEQRDRPIIFVAHSLGGLIVKKAMAISNNNVHLRHILWAVKGVIFLATPHLGSRMANVAYVAYKALHFPTDREADQLIKALKLRSPELSIIGKEFGQIADLRNLSISSIYELYPLKLFLFISHKV
jgi:hypothetical protein